MDFRIFQKVYILEMFTNITYIDNWIKENYCDGSSSIWK